MASLNLTLLLTATFLTLTLLTKPTHSATCDYQTFPNKTYTNCIDLPTLSSYLHYTYNSTNTSLSIAFVAPPAKPDGWVSWAINPNATGMVGAQAFIAFKLNGSLTVKTYDIVSYSNLTESKLSFDVWDVSSISNSTSGDYTIFASVKVPSSSLEKLNYIWQVGPSVTNGHPDKHEFATANLNSKKTLGLAGTIAKAPWPAAAPSPQGGAGWAPSPQGGAGLAPNPQGGGTTNSTAAPPGDSKNGGSRCGFNYYLGLVGVGVVLGCFVGF